MGKERTSTAGQSGQGAVPEDYLEQIVEPFFTTKERSRGVV